MGSSGVVPEIAFKAELEAVLCGDSQRANAGFQHWSTRKMLIDLESSCGWPAKVDTRELVQALIGNFVIGLQTVAGAVRHGFVGAAVKPPRAVQAMWG
jgi:hypothetical protein